MNPHPRARLQRLLAAGLRPEDVSSPGPGQVSVWDYPRPPELVPEPRRLRVVFGGRVIADTQEGLRLGETASPPTYYFPPQAVAADVLHPSRHRSLCEWKGQARYFDVVAGGARAPNAAWSYPGASGAYQALAGWIAFMPGLMEACHVGDEKARPQPGRFYGGWITDDLTGPFKGEPGTLHW